MTISAETFENGGGKSAPHFRGMRAKISRRILRWTGAQFGSVYLDQYGWQVSKQQSQPVDRDRNPVPWYTYPAFEVIRRAVKPSHRVFEYGCGNSSLWWAGATHSVISVEHHPEWAAKIAARAPKNLTVLFRGQGHDSKPDPLKPFFERYPDQPLSGNNELDVEHGLQCHGFSDYVTEIFKYPKFDIIVVDGMARSLTAWVAAQHLTPDGFIVFDNSDRWQYNPGYQALSDMGFGRVDFWGPGPVNTSRWCTSIFSKTQAWTKPLITLDPRIRSSLDWVIESRQTP